MPQRVTAITVTHNGGLVIGALLDSLPSDIPLLVVDNASIDDTLEIVSMKRPDASVLRNSIGLGYGSAANQGLKNVTTEFALLVNPDSLLNEDAIASLIEAADEFPDAAMLGPKHQTVNGQTELSHDVDLWKRKRYGKRCGEPIPKGPICADFLSGAVVLVRISAIRSIGFYDPEIFLYFEDDDICIRLRQAGYSLVLVPKSVVVHLNSGSVRPSRSYYWEKFWHFAWSRIYIEGKYHGITARTILAIRLGFLFGCKAIANAIVGRRHNCSRDMARFAGTIAALFGVRVAVKQLSKDS